MAVFKHLRHAGLIRSVDAMKAATTLYELYRDSEGTEFRLNLTLQNIRSKLKVSPVCLRFQDCSWLLTSANLSDDKLLLLCVVRASQLGWRIFLK